MMAPQQLCTPAERVVGLAPYATSPHGPHIDLALDANEGPRPTRDLIHRLAAINPEAVRRYPSAAVLEAQIADTLGVAPSQVVVTNGGDDAIDRVCRATLQPWRELVIHTPTFEMIERSALLAGAAVRRVPWESGPFPLEGLTALYSERTALAAIVSPNNPTGAIATTDQIMQAAAAAERTGTVLMADLAYVEYADADPMRDLIASPAVVSIRTFSKSKGLAGLRVGYAVASPEIARWLRTVGGPYPVSSLSLALAAASIGTTEHEARSISLIRGERARIAELLADLGARPIPSQANFVAFRHDRAGLIRSALDSIGIAVRGFPGREGLSDLLRVTMPGNDADADRLARALSAAIRPQALIIPRHAGDLPDRLDSPSGVVAIVRANAPLSDESIAAALASSAVLHAWAACGTVAEVQAARRAGVVPVGVPGNSAARGDFAGAGVAATAESIGRITEILP